jgi:hypothetical protein
MSPTTCRERNRGRNSERNPNGIKNTESRKIAARDLQKNSPEPQPGYGRDVPGKSQSLLGEIITAEKLRKRATKQSDQYVPFA